MLKELFTVKETAIILGVSERTIYNQTHKKAVRRFPIEPVRVGRALRFRRVEIEQIIGRVIRP